MRFAFPMALALCVTANQASASTIYGMNVRLGEFISSDTGGFVAGLTTVGSNTDPIFALDFDAAATTLWGINNTTLEYGTFTLGTGLFNPAGVVGGITGATGLTASPDGTTWWLMEYNATSAASFLWKGDVTTGTFTLVGQSSAGIMIDISMNCDGTLWGHNISDDSLYSIDTVTGAGTLIGGTGLLANFAQGMDFDWSDGTLYATIYTGGGTGMFCTMNLTTGAATPLEDTVSTNGEFEIAIRETCSGPTAPGTPLCFGDGSGAPCGCGTEATPGSGSGCNNSLGVGGVLSGTGSADTTNDTLSLTCSGVRAQPGLFFQGNNTIGGGTGVTFGDGIRCCGQNVVRLQIVTPPQPQPATAVLTVTVTNQGPAGTVNPGDKKCYQYWYRDPGGSPCGSNFNFSNAYTVTWS